MDFRLSLKVLKKKIAFDPIFFFWIQSYKHSIDMCRTIPFANNFILVFISGAIKFVFIGAGKVFVSVFKFERISWYEPLFLYSKASIPNPALCGCECIPNSGSLVKFNCNCFYVFYIFRFSYFPFFIFLFKNCILLY